MMQTWEQTYGFTGAGTVEVHQRDGHLRIVGWDRPEVLVKASWPGEGRLEERLEIEGGPNRLALEVKPYRSGFLGLMADSRLDLEISVPQGTRCKLETGSGPVTVESTRGTVEVDSGSGRIAVADVAQLRVDAGSGSVQVHQVAGPVNVQTGSGRIEVETVVGPAVLEAGSGSLVARRIGNGLRADTGSGSITVSDVEGECYLDSSSGSVQVSRVVSPHLHVEAASGSVRAEVIDAKDLSIETGSGRVQVALLRIHPQGAYKIETGSGRVEVNVPADAGFRAEIDSHGGVTWGDLPVRIVSREDDEISAVVGAGGPLFEIETGSGAVAFRAVQAPAPSDSEVATARLAGLVKDDPALEQSEQMSRILQMVQEGKLSVQEAEQLLRALDGEEG